METNGGTDTSETKALLPGRWVFHSLRSSNQTRQALGFVRNGVAPAQNLSAWREDAVLVSLQSRTATCAARG